MGMRGRRTETDRRTPPRRWTGLLAATCGLLVAVVAVSASPAVPATIPPSTAAGPGSGTGVVPDAIVDRYLSRRPPLADEVTVIDVSSEPGDRILLATTMQGLLNRDEAQIYLIGSAFDGPHVDQRWLDEYVSLGLVTVGETIDLDTALDRFAAELGGYVLATPDEAWTFNVATTVAAVEDGVVATPTTVDALIGRGIPEIDDLRGRWSTGAEAYTASVAAYADRVDLRAVAVNTEGRHGNRDLYVQQGILPVYTNPSDGDFEEIYDLFSAFPVEHPIYGYVSSTGDEEIVALLEIADQNRYLLPTATMNNLSFHLAVGADRPRAVPAPPDPGAVEPCTSDDTNVVLSISDGDNLRVPLSELVDEDWWASPRRGEIPLGVSISPAAAVLMPSVWDHYASTADIDTELVSMMGIGYTLSTFMSDPRDYYRDSFALGAALGLDTFWSLDPTLGAPDAAGWGPLLTEADASPRPPSLYLFSYEDFGGPAGGITTTGVPYLRSQATAFGQDPARLAAEIQELVDTPEAERPLVTFFAVTVWSTDLPRLIDALGPLQDQGVRLLSQTEARACLTPEAEIPDPDPEPPTSTTTSTTSTSAPSTPTAPNPDRPGGPAVPIPAPARFAG